MVECDSFIVENECLFAGKEVIKLKDIRSIGINTPNSIMVFTVTVESHINNGD